MDSGPAPKRAHPGMTAARIIVNDAGSLTRSLHRLTFTPFRGHLSRPACSHVKKLAKQAGDRRDPGRTLLFRPVFLWPGFRTPLTADGGGRYGKGAVDHKPSDPSRGSRA